MPIFRLIPNIDLKTVIDMETECNFMNKRLLLKFMFHVEHKKGGISLPLKQNNYD